MTEREGEKVFNELCAYDLSDCPSDFEINCSDLESNSLSEDSYESNIKLLKRQKRNVIEF